MKWTALVRSGVFPSSKNPYQFYYGRKISHTFQKLDFLKFLSKPVSRGLSFKRLYKERQNVKESANSENEGGGVSPSSKNSYKFYHGRKRSLKVLSRFDYIQEK